MSGVLGVVVAGGAGARLGLGVPKAMAPYAGGTLLDAAVACLSPLCDRVVVAAPLAVPLGAHEGRRVVDVAGAEGPLAGLVAGLASHAYTRAIVIAVDLPRLRTATLAGLLERLAGAMAVVPCPGSRPEPLAVALDAGAAVLLCEALAAGERSVMRALERLDPVRLDDAALAAMGAVCGEFADVDTSADLAVAERDRTTRAAVAQ